MDDNGGAEMNARSLAMVVSGKCVEVTCVLFDIVRARCADLGLAVGDTIRVIGRTDVHVALKTARGTIALVEREIAQFIVVGDAPSTVPLRERASYMQTSIAL
jgi:hypothetical protein